jgi:hypothetical protein
MAMSASTCRPDSTTPSIAPAASLSSSSVPPPLLRLERALRLIEIVYRPVRPARHLLDSLVSHLRIRYGGGHGLAGPVVVAEEGDRDDHDDHDCRGERIQTRGRRTVYPVELKRTSGLGVSRQRPRSCFFLASNSASVMIPCSFSRASFSISAYGSASAGGGGAA